jgi:hypothetical protein
MSAVSGEGVTTVLRALLKVIDGARRGANPSDSQAAAWQP